MRFAFLLIVSLHILISGCAQTQKSTTAIPAETLPQSDAHFIFDHIIPGNFSFMDVDVLDNVFVITTSNQLKKLSFNGDSISVYNDVKKYGNPSYIDVSNPLKILVYYRNYATVVSLDRLLGFRNSLNFRKENIFTARAVATSYDNNIWLFDEQDFKLKKIKDDGTLLQESNDMRISFPSVPLPVRIVDQNNYVYLYDPVKGFFIFDYYGAFKNNLPYLGWAHIAISGDIVFGFDDKNLYSYDTKNPELKTYTLPSFFKGYKDIKAINGKVYLLMADGIYIYKVL